MGDLLARIRAWERWEPPIGKMPADYPAPQPVEWSEARARIEALEAMLKECAEVMEQACHHLDQSSHIAAIVSVVERAKEMLK